MTNETIFIVGAGAIGKALAVFLIRDGRNVVLLRGSVDNDPVHQQQITVITGDNETTAATVPVSSFANYTRLDGLVVLTNKSFGNERIAALLRARKVTGPLVLLQNGLGVEDAFINAGFSDVYRCVLFATCQPVAENVYRFKPVAPSAIGRISWGTDQSIMIVERLTTPSFLFTAEEMIRTVIWKKAIANSVFNSVCVLLDTDNGIFHRNAAASLIAEKVITECIAIAALEDVHLKKEEVLDSLLLISRRSDGQLISTLQDIRNGRLTEIDSLNLAIAQKAQALGRPELVTATQLLGELTKLKSTITLPA